MGALRDHIRTPLHLNAYALILNSGVTSLLGVAYWVIAARRYQTDVVGANSAIISAMMFLAGIAQVNLGSVMIRFIPASRHNAPRLIAFGYTLSFILATILSLLVLFSVRIWTPNREILQRDWRSSLLFVTGTVCFAIFNLQDTVLTGLRRTLWIPIENLTFGVLKLILLVIFSFASFRLGIALSWIVPATVLLLPINALIFGRFLPAHTHAASSEESQIGPWRYTIKYVLADYLGAMLALASTTLMPILVTQIAGSRDNAYFYQCWSIVASLQLVIAGRTTSFQVESTWDRSQFASNCLRTLKHTLLLILPLVIIIILSAPYFLAVFGRDYAEQGQLLLRVLALAAIPNIAVQLAVSIARVKRDALAVMIIQGAICALAISLSCWLLPTWGILGVGIAWVFSQSVVAAFILTTNLRWLLRDLLKEVRWKA